jgi:predicted RNA-binding protein YlxR (DUF448 family)
MPLHEIHDVRVESDGAETPRNAEARCGPTRRCIVTGATLPIGNLVRFVVGPGEYIVPDICAALPGRGLWLSADRNTVKTAIAQRFFGRAVRQAVNVADDLVDQVESLLAQRCVDLIGLARRGGQSICGFEKVRGWLEDGVVGCLVIAAESAAGGREKLIFMNAGASITRALTADEIGRAFGRENLVFAAFKTGGLARKFIVDAERLDGFREIRAVGRTSCGDEGEVENE